MEAIGVLGHDRGQAPRGLHGRQRLVSRIGAGGQGDRTALFRDPPIGGGVGEEAFDRGYLHRVVLGPQATLAPEGRNPAFGRDAGTGQGEALARGRQELRGASDCQMNNDCLAYSRWLALYALAAASVGIGTQGEPGSSRIAVTLKMRNFSALLPLS